MRQDGKNDGFFLMRLEPDTVWEPAHVRAAVFLEDYLVGQRVILDPGHDFLRGFQEPTDSAGPPSPA